jgi:alpha-tubulin suppressor-like RCC1 family protein
VLQGKVRCWGYNGFGCVGSGITSLKVTAPSAEISSLVGVTDIAAGRFHTCAAHGAGLSCWGYNSYGQLGNADPSFKNVPVLVVNPLPGTFTQLSAGYDTTCGLLSNGTLACWGYNSFGQLGIGSTINKSVPTLVTFPGSVTLKQVAVGGFHACALSQSQTLYCWGSNERGQTGVGDEASKPRQVDISVNASEKAKSIAAGLNASCATSDTGNVYCWGDNGRGQLGFAAPDTDALSPIALPIPAK